LTPDELRALIKQLGLPQTRVAQCLGIERRTVVYWLSGERAIPEPIARILRLAAAGRINLNELEEKL